MTIWDGSFEKYQYKLALLRKEAQIMLDAFPSPDQAKKRIAAKEQERQDMLAADKARPGYIKNLAQILHAQCESLSWESTRDILKNRQRLVQESITPDDAWLDLPSSRPYLRRYERRRIYAWGDDKGNIARRLEVCDANSLSPAYIDDKTFVEGTLRHRAIYTRDGKLQREEFYAADGTEKVFTTNLTDRIKNSVLALLGRAQETPAQAHLKELRNPNAVISVMVLLENAHPDVALRVAHAALSLRALWRGDDVSRAALAQAAESAIAPNYAQRVVAAQEMAAVHRDVTAMLNRLATQRDTMDAFPLAQDTLQSIYADTQAQLAQHAPALAEARALLHHHDTHSHTNCAVADGVHKAIIALRDNPPALERLYQELSKYYEGFRARDGVLDSLQTTHKDLRKLVEQTNRRLHSFAQKMENEGAVMARAMEMAGLDGVDTSGVLRPLDTPPAPAKPPRPR